MYGDICAIVGVILS